MLPVLSLALGEMGMMVAADSGGAGVDLLVDVLVIVWPGALALFAPENR